MTIMYLGWANSWCQHVFDGWDYDAFPLDMLVAFPDLRSYRTRMVKTPVEATMHNRMRSRFLDSGAFSAFRSGKTIDHAALMVEQRLPIWTDVASLDVIGDWKASRANWMREREAGVVTMPTFHIGDPWELLQEYKRLAPKVALGGIAPLRDATRMPWLRQVFARAWPHRFHAFGVMSSDILRALPFHSCDATGWYQAIVMGGAGCTPDGKTVIGARSSTVTRIRQARSKAEAMIRLGQELSHKWRNALASIPHQERSPS